MEVDLEVVVVAAAAKEHELHALRSQSEKEATDPKLRSHVLTSTLVLKSHVLIRITPAH